MESNNTYRIESNDNKLTIELEGKFNLLEFVEALNNDNLQFYHSMWDGWQYIYDIKRDLVFRLDDHYGYSEINNLKAYGSIVLDGFPNDDDYTDYEWRY